MPKVRSVARRRQKWTPASSHGGWAGVAVQDLDKAGRRIFFLNTRCEVTRTASYPSRPRDTEDLALAKDGTLWVGDIGDNNENRDTIGLWRLAPGAKSAKLQRLTYPDGAHNAEALLLTQTDSPIIVTKTVGSASVYVLDAGSTTRLRRAGYVTVPVTTTSNPFSLPGRLTITGGGEGRVSTRLEGVEPDAVALCDGTRLETETLVWTAGIAPNPVLEDLGVPLDERGRVVVDASLKVADRDEALHSLHWIVRRGSEDLVRLAFRLHPEVIR